MQPCSWLAAGRLLLLPSGEFEDEALVLRTSYDATAEQQALDSSVDQRTDALITTYAFHEIPEHRLEALEEGSAYAPVRDLLLNATAYILDIDLDFFVRGEARPHASGHAQGDTSDDETFPLLSHQIPKTRVE